MDFKDMPQPLKTRVTPNATLSPTPNALVDKPDMAIVVTQIFATWAEIEQQLSVMIIQIVGGNQDVALAIYSILETQGLKQRALESAAKAKLEPNDYQIFLAAISAAESAATPRNQLAHWPWAICPQRTDLLLLVDPKAFKKREISLTKFYEGTGKATTEELSSIEIDTALVQTYTPDDLKRALRDIVEVHETISIVSKIINTNSVVQNLRDSAETAKIRDQLLQQLNAKRLYREAAARLIQKGKDNNQPKTNG